MGVVTHGSITWVGVGVLAAITKVNIVVGVLVKVKILVGVGDNVAVEVTASVFVGDGVLVDNGVLVNVTVKNAVEVEVITGLLAGLFVTVFV